MKQILLGWECLEFYEETTVQTAFQNKKIGLCADDTRGLKDMGTLTTSGQGELSAARSIEHHGFPVPQICTVVRLCCYAF